MRDKYQWLVDRMKSELTGDVHLDESDYGHRVCVTYKVGEGNDMLRKSFVVQGEHVAHCSDGDLIIEVSLNDLPELDKEQQVQRMISTFKGMHNGNES